MNRRQFTGLLALGAAASLVRQSGVAQASSEAARFNRATLVELARQMAGQDYEPPKKPSAWLASLTYDQYRMIRFKPKGALWRGEARGFTLDLLPNGFLFGGDVDVHIVSGGTAKKLNFDPELFDYTAVPKFREAGASFSGFRLRAPINTLSHLDEFAVFQGASYFRAVGRNQGYGLSARGLAVNTAVPGGEEYPDFRAFWIERPEPASKQIVVHALLDSPSVTGAFRFAMMPGAATVMEVDASLFARDDLQNFGLAPLTSMYLFGQARKTDIDDFRSAVHDSDGLLIRRGTGDQIWRPLANPSELKLSYFAENRPKGFGLMQRAQDLADFQDLEARYELRPSAWIEPKGDWGAGHVVLMEIPTELETNDNIVAFWKPESGLKKGSQLDIGYWMSWGPPIAERSLARVHATRIGRDMDGKTRRIVIDFVPASFGDKDLRGAIQPKVWSSSGKIEHVAGRYTELLGCYRLSFALQDEGEPMIELGAVLQSDERAVSEIWQYKLTD